MQLSRRKLLVSAAPVVALGLVGLGGCTSSQLAQAEQDWNNFIDQVNGLLAAGCGFVPGVIATASTISAVVGALYPSIGAAIAAGAGAVQAVAGAICTALSANPVSMKKRLLRSTPSVPVAVTTIINGKPVQIVVYKR